MPWSIWSTNPYTRERQQMLAVWGGVAFGVLAVVVILASITTFFLTRLWRG